MRNAIAGVVGLAFGLGLCLSGMNEPSKVLAFLDLAGDWDPSLAFVMGGAIALALPAFALARRRRIDWSGQPIDWPEQPQDRRPPCARSAHLRRGLGSRGALPRAWNSRRRISQLWRDDFRCLYGGGNPCFSRAEFALAYAKGSYSGRIGAVAGRGMFGKPPGRSGASLRAVPLFFVRPKQLSSRVVELTAATPRAA